MSVRLSSLSSPLPPTLLQHLRDINVRTAADLILTPPEELLRLLPRGSTTLGEVLDCVESVTHQVAGEAVVGDALYEAAQFHEAESEDVMSGVDGLDALLGGSFGGTSGGRVIEISGDNGGGKTVSSDICSCTRAHPRQGFLCVWIGPWAALDFSSFV